MKMVTNHVPASAVSGLLWKAGRVMLIGLSVLSILGGTPSPVRADPAITIHVNTLVDQNLSNSVISLREAILLVNGGTSGDGIRTGLGRSLNSGETALITGGTIGGSATAATIVFSSLGGAPTINLSTVTGMQYESLPPIRTSGVVIDGLSGAGIPVTINGSGLANTDILWLGWNDQATLPPNSAIPVSNVTIRNLVISGATRYGIQLDPASNSLISGCTVTGSISYAVYINGKFGASDHNILENSRIGGNHSLGVVINRPDSNNTTIRNNLIGVNATGTLADANTGAGIALFTGAHDNLITGNLISGNTLQGIYFDGTTNSVGNVMNNTITNNKIGTAMDGVSPLPNVQGIVFGQNSSQNTVGGTSAGQANTIAYNTESGVVLVGYGTYANRITGNSIYKNTFLGIDLWDDKLPTQGVSGGGSGPNHISLRPNLTTAQAHGSTGVIAGTTSPNATVEFFVADPSPSGYGSGKTYCGSVTADASGNFRFTGTMSCTPGTSSITATSTLADGSTSEFGNNLATTHLPMIYLPLMLRG
jgi:parallel beta-helix repeat protein